MKIYALALCLFGILGASCNRSDSDAINSTADTRTNASTADTTYDITPLTIDFANASGYTYLGYTVYAGNEESSQKLFDNNVPIAVDASFKPFKTWQCFSSTSQGRLKEMVKNSIALNDISFEKSSGISEAIDRQLTNDMTEEKGRVYVIGMLTILKGKISFDMSNPSFIPSFRTNQLKLYPNPADFQQKWGNKFISSAVIGGSILILFEFNNVDLSHAGTAPITSSAIAAIQMFEVGMSTEQVKARYKFLLKSDFDLIVIGCCTQGVDLPVFFKPNDISSILSKATSQVDKSKNLTSIFKKYTSYNTLTGLNYPFIHP